MIYDIPALKMKYKKQMEDAGLSAHLTNLMLSELDHCPISRIEHVPYEGPHEDNRWVDFRHHINRMEEICYRKHEMPVGKLCGPYWLAVDFTETDRIKIVLTHENRTLKAEERYPEGLAYDDTAPETLSLIEDLMRVSA